MTTNLNNTRCCTLNQLILGRTFANSPGLSGSLPDREQISQSPIQFTSSVCGRETGPKSGKRSISRFFFFLGGGDVINILICVIIYNVLELSIRTQSKVLTSIFIFLHFRVQYDFLTYLAKFQSITNIRSHSVFTFISENLRPPLLDLVPRLGCELEKMTSYLQKYLTG